MVPEHEPDFYEKIVRFVCGFLGGGIFGFILILQMEVGPTHEAALWMAGSALVSAVCAVEFGDRFWKVILLLFGTW